MPIRYHELDDLRAREELVERFLPLARDLARRYAYTDEPFKDLLQVASEIGVRIGYSQMHISRLLRRGSTGSSPPPHRTIEPVEGGDVRGPRQSGRL